MHHLIEVTPRHARLCQVFLRELAVAEDRTQDVVEVMRDAAGERAHRVHHLRLTELSLEALLRVFGLLALNGDARKMGDLLYNIVLLPGRAARFAIVCREGPQHPTV